MVLVCLICYSATIPNMLLDTPRIELKSDKKMIEILNEIASLSGNGDWLTKKNGASIDQINKTQDRLGLVLPKDYCDFISVTDGFKAPSDIHSTFHSIEEIDFFRNAFPDVSQYFTYISVELDRSIVVAGKNEEQQFLLIPPLTNKDEWKYWAFANWIPGEESYRDLKAYFLSVLDFLKTN